MLLVVFYENECYVCMDLSVPCEHRDPVGQKKKLDPPNWSLK